MAARRGGGFVLVLSLLLVLAQASAAWAHASLVRTEPAADTVLPQPPETLKLHFNEPVSPLVMRIVGPNGEAISPSVAAENETVTLTPPRLGRGTHVLSWRVISSDGHPVGGSLLFSVGAATAGPDAEATDTDPAVRIAIWTARVTIYFGLFFGLGGLLFAAWLAPGAVLPRGLGTLTVAALALGFLASVISVALQGLDALALPLAQGLRTEVWRTGFGTTYGATAIIAGLSLLLGLVVMQTNSVSLRRVLSSAALAGGGLALAVSGHAGTAGPWMVSRPSVFLHVVCVAFWIGSLVPLLASLRSGAGEGALRRFTRAIPVPLTVLALTGLLLAYLQLDRFDALWTTSYGEVLFRKLVLVAMLLVLAAANRFWLVPRFEANGAAAAPPLLISIAAETVIAVVILGLVATWRFTPPPRALAAALEPIAFHIHGAPAMANFQLTPSRGRGGRLDILMLDTEVRPLAVKEVKLILSNPKAGIEPLQRDAVFAGDTTWRIDDLRIPIAGRWNVKLDVLINDFENTTIDDDIDLPHTP